MYKKTCAEVKIRPRMAWRLIHHFLTSWQRVAWNIWCDFWASTALVVTVAAFVSQQALHRKPRVHPELPQVGHGHQPAAADPPRHVQRPGPHCECSCPAGCLLCWDGQVSMPACSGKCCPLILPASEIHYRIFTLH